MSEPTPWRTFSLGKGKASAERYIKDVVGRRIVVGQRVRQCVDRHVRDLETAKKRGLHFDKKAAQHVLDFFSLLRHSKGEWAGEPFVLSPVAGIHPLGPLRLEARRRPTPVPYRLCRDRPQERKIDSRRRNRSLPLCRRPRTGSGGLHRRNETGSGADRPRRGRQHGPVVAGSPALHPVFQRQPLDGPHELEVSAPGCGRRHDGWSERPRRDHR